MANDFVQRWIDSYNSRSFSIEDLYTSDATLTEGGPTMRGPTRSGPISRAMSRRFQMVATSSSTRSRRPVGSRSRVRFTGTNTSPTGDTPATGKRVEWPFAVVFDMENGKAKAHRGYGDQVSLLTQLGLMPAPAGV